MATTWRARLVKPRPLMFLVIITVWVWPGLFYLYVNGFRPGEEWAPVIDSEGFRVGMRGQWRDSCVALSSFKSFDRVIVGSSHAYRGIDGAVLSETLPGRRVGLCGLPLWGMPHFDLFLDFLRDSDISVQRLVWIADAGSFLIRRGEVARTERNALKEVLVNQTSRNRERLSWAVKSLLRGGALGVTRAQYDDALARQRRRFAAIDPTMVEAIMVDRTFPDERRLKSDIMDVSRVVSDPEAALRHLCAELDRRAIALDVVVYPVPERTERLFRDALDWGPLADVGGYFRDSMPCAASVVEGTMADWGLDIRDYLDLSGDKAAAIWESPTRFAEIYPTLTDGEKKRLVDADHLNALGAVTFTRRLVERLSATEGWRAEP